MRTRCEHRSKVESDGQPQNITGLPEVSHGRQRLALTLRAPGAFPSYLRTRIARSASQRNYILLTSVAGDAATPPAGGGETRTTRAALAGSAPHPPRSLSIPLGG